VFGWAILSGFEVLNLGINESTYLTSSYDMDLDGKGNCLFSIFMGIYVEKVQGVQ
jgi:hypothetical protein